MKSRLIHVVVVIALHAPSMAVGQEGDVTLQDAIAFENEGQLVQALEAFRLVLQVGGNSREDIATIYLHLALLQQASGDRDGARDAMYRLLAVDPEPELPVSAPPDVAELLEEARRLWSGRRLRAELYADEEVADGEDWPVRVVVHDDVPGMVDGVALVSNDEVVARREGRSPFELVVPAADLDSEGNTTVEARLLDEHGGTIWVSEPLRLSSLPEDPVEPDPTPPPLQPVDSGGQRAPLWIAGWALFGTGLALGGVGAAMVAIDERPTGSQREVAAGIEEEILNTDLAGWILVGVGSAAFVASIVLVVLGRNRSGDDETTARIARALCGAIDF
jgi:hypothetical protein